MRVFIFALVLIISGCSTGLVLHNEAGLNENNVSYIWLHSDAVQPFRIVDFNGKSLGGGSPTKIEDVPGKKELTLEMWNAYIDKKSGKRYMLQYDFSFSSKAGYSYNFKLTEGYYLRIGTRAKVCLLEEPHNALGSKINMTGEYREPSKNAKILSCKRPRFVDLT